MKQLHQVCVAATASLCVLTAMAQPCSNSWHEVARSGDFPNLTEATLTYDSLRCRLIIAGLDRLRNDPQFQIWEWDGTRFTLCFTEESLRDPRHLDFQYLDYGGFSSVYSPALGGAAVLRSDDGTWGFTSSWTWNGSNSPFGFGGDLPSNLEGFNDTTMAYDPSNGEIVLHGGWAFFDNHSDLTCSFDGARWSIDSYTRLDLGCPDGFHASSGGTLVANHLGQLSLAVFWAVCGPRGIWSRSGNGWGEPVIPYPPETGQNYAFWATYSRAQRAILLFSQRSVSEGGTDVGSRVHRLEGTQWQEIPVVGSPPRIPGDVQSVFASNDCNGTIYAYQTAGGNTHDRPARLYEYDPDPSRLVADRPSLVLSDTDDGASISVAITGRGPFSYQWRRDGVPIPDAFPFQGSLTSSLSFSTRDIPCYGGSYDCVVSNPCTTITSQSLPVSMPRNTGDFNNDGGVDGQDVQAFFETFVTGSPTADVNCDGGVDGADIESFFTCWAANC
jgi:hypothetical protein